MNLREVVIGSLSKKYVVAMQSILRKKRGDVSHLDFSTKFYLLFITISI